MAKKHSALLMRTYVILVFCFMYLPIAVMICEAFCTSLDIVAVCDDCVQLQ